MIGAINFIICQWFFFRIAKVYANDSKKVVGFGILFPVVPLTGWNYIPLNPKFWRLW